MAIDLQNSQSQLKHLVLYIWNQIFNYHFASGLQLPSSGLSSALARNSNNYIRLPSASLCLRMPCLTKYSMFRGVLRNNLVFSVFFFVCALDSDSHLQYMLAQHLVRINYNLHDVLVAFLLLLTTESLRCILPVKLPSLYIKKMPRHWYLLSVFLLLQLLHKPCQYVTAWLRCLSSLYPSC